VVAPDVTGLAAMRRVGSLAAALERGLEASPRVAHSLLAAGGARAAEETRALAAIDVAARPLDMAPEDAAPRTRPRSWPGGCRPRRRCSAPTSCGA
jgi:hypothetical protein